MSKKEPTEPTLSTALVSYLHQYPAITGAETGGGVFDIKENLDGERLEFPIIKILHAGVEMFELAEGKKVDTFEGLILWKGFARMFWVKSFQETGGGVPPDCWSNDMLKPDGSVEFPQYPRCGVCSQNRWGSDVKGGKACKETRRLFLVLPGDFLPSKLVVSPGNLKPTLTFFTNLANRGLDYSQVIVRFSLERVVGKQSKIAYSGLVFEPVQEITDKAVLVRLKALRETYLPAMRALTPEMLVKEYTPEELSVDNKADIPF